MTHELDPAGYRWLRARVAERWRYLAVYDVDMNEVARLDTQADPRVTVTVNDATAEVEYEARLRGTDPELAGLLPVRLGATRLFPTADGDDGRSRVSYAGVVIETTAESKTLRHTVHVPAALLQEVYVNGS
ncbi:MAG: hypothetical protein GXY82_00730 [Methanospirillum sp.]|nr:hypothetical protein [Methanospirillum sp.]